MCHPRSAEGKAAYIGSALLLGMEIRQAKNGTWDVRIGLNLVGREGLVFPTHRWCNQYPDEFTAALEWARMSNKHLLIMEGLRAAKIYPD